jgi:3-dehydroquinate synthase
MMEKIVINTSVPYEVLLENGLLGHAGEVTARVVEGRRVMIVCDGKIAPQYLNAVQDAFERTGFETSSYLLHGGERGKTLATVEQLITAAAKADLGHDSLFAALGGGVTGDITGLAAALYMRGIDWIQLPTTLLAMADAAAGGKTAVNAAGEKNLIGAFHQPRLVLCDPEVLKTLPLPLLNEGMAEIVKYGAVGSTKLLDSIRNGERPEMLIAACIRMKAAIVEHDEHDRGQRRLLNFGHTFGHALERLNDFTIYHGEGVAVGMLIAAFAAVKHGLCPASVYEELRLLLKMNHLPVNTRFRAAEIARIALRDKKRNGDMITVVIPSARGRCELFSMPTRELEGFIACCDENVTACSEDKIREV